MNARNKKLCIILLPLAGFALFVDRVILGGGTDAVDEALAAVVIPAAPPVELAPVESVLIPELPFPRDLPVLPAASLTRDWFHPPEDSLSAKADALLKAEGRTASGKKVLSEQERFAAENSLSGIVATGDVRLAILNGRRKRVGDSVGNCIVRTIRGRTVWFDCAGTTVQLTLFDDPKGQSN